MSEPFEYTGRDLESMGFAKRYHRHILKIFKPYLGQRVVEVGAGDGAVTELISELGVGSVTAIEPSEKMFELLKGQVAEKSNGRITPKQGFLADFTDDLKRDRPDSFVYINVFEHIEDDVAEIKRTFDVLQPGGHLCIFVPAMPSLFSDFDRSIDHYRRYRLRELQEKCQAAGFTIAKSRYFDWLGVLPWWLRFRLFKAKSLSPGAVRLYDWVGVPIIKLTEAIIKPPVGKNVLLIAEKPA